MNSQAKAHFKLIDPDLYALIDKIDPVLPFDPKCSEDYFEQLCDAIVSQQLATKAAETIFGRFKALFPNYKITPQGVLKLSDEQLRLVGLSRAKASYIKDLAQKVDSGELKLTELSQMEDEEVIERLVKIKGIGRWTAEMFLIFTLGREDVFSLGDLGLKNALKKVYGEKTTEQLEELIKKWSPYKSYAARILWRSLNIKP